MNVGTTIAARYRTSVEEALATIVTSGSDEHRRIASLILESEMELRVRPVSVVNASGVTGLVDPSRTNDRIAEERLSIREALGEIYIAIAEETIDTGGQRGCEGTLVHEGRHAYDFARMIASFSNADVNPLSVFDPTLYELELAAHQTSGEYMLKIGADEYLAEGVQLNILCRTEGGCSVSDDGITARLRESYGLDAGERPGPTASELLGVRPK